MSLEPSEKKPKDVDVSAMALLTRAVKLGHKIDDAATEKLIDLAIRIVENVENRYTPRDQRQAQRTLMAFRSESVTVALKMAEWERLDKGKSSGNLIVKMYDKDAPTEDV